MYGVKPVIIAVVVQALWSLGRSAVKTKPLVVLGIIAAASVFAGVEELAVLLGGGLFAMVLSKPPIEKKPGAEKSSTKSNAFVLGAGWMGALGASSAASASSWSLLLVFAKIGSVLFGSGYVLLAFLRADLVERRHWMTEGQLVDAVAVGQLTPGPVFTTATFVGYLIHGFSGAAAATAGIFLPAFAFIALSGLIIPKLRSSRRAGAFLDGVNVASLSLMTVVTVQLGRAALVDAVTLLLAAGSVLLLFKWKVNSVWLIMAGAIAGAAASALT
jgi:chromate transporter